MQKTFDEKMAEANEKIRKEKEKMKAWVAAENQRLRKERNHRLFMIGGLVESIIKFDGDENLYKKNVERLLKIGLSADEILGHPADANLVKFFLQNQEERGNYFSKFIFDRENHQ